MAAVQDNALFDTHLQSLLKNAEKRLEEKSRSLDTADESPRHEAIPQYDPEKRLVTRPYVAVEDGIARAQAAPQPGQTHQHSSNSLIRRVEDPAVTRERATKKKTADAGREWYHLPRTNLTPAMKRDFQLLQMRNVLDTHRHYRKSDDAGKFPEYSQSGTVIEGPTEFYSGRIRNRERKQTLAEEILATEDTNRKFKAKYTEIQAKRTSGKKAHYKARLARRARNRPR